jgi:hypothetical protein
MIYLGNDGSSTGLLRLLEVLLNSKKDSEEMLEIFKNEFDIKVTEELKKEVSHMCNISAGVREEGGIDKALELIKNLMKNAGWSIEQAMKMAGVPDEEQSVIRERLNK